MKYSSFFFFILLFIACAEEPPPKLSMNDKNIADSIFKERVQIIKPERDSLCEALFEGRVQKAVDSILLERRAEIEAQMDRIRQLELENN